MTLKWTGLVVFTLGAAILAVIVVAAWADSRGRALARMQATSDAHAAQRAPGKQLWHCGMHPQVIQDHPGDCPICHMALTPINSPGGPEITIDSRVVQEMGVQTAHVTRAPIHKTIRAVGTFELPQPGMHDVSLKVGGWIDKLYADQEGMHVHQGEPLLAIYSPELQVAEQELIAAVKSRQALGAEASATLQKESDAMIASARRKLQLWDVAGEDIDAVAKAGQPPRDIVFRSPAGGHVEDKMVVQGSSVQAGMKLMRIADHTTMWLDAQVYEEQIPLVKLGQAVEATLDALPGKTFSGKITFIYPHLDHMTRTLMVRATFDNPNFELKPGMYADTNILAMPVSDATQVPQEAVIDTGTKQIVFVAQGEGHFGPRTVRTGIRGDDDKVQILEGLSMGETVVTSGEFLMDVESRTQEAIAKLRGSPAHP